MFERSFVNFLDETDDLMDVFFGHPSISFNTGHTKDMSPVYWVEVKDKNCYRAEVRSVGINENDVHVNVLEKSINVSGKSKYEDIDYDFTYSLPVPASIITNLEKVEYKVLNGITYIYVYVKKEKKEPKISATKI